MPVQEYPPVRAAGRGRGWYRGDFHVHSAVSSGGELTPGQLAAAARAVGLDFLAVTEHNTTVTHGAWGPHAGDDLLVILGQEVVTPSGHWLALGLPPGQTVGGRDGDGRLGGSRSRGTGAVTGRHPLVRHLDEVHRAGGLCVAAHPHAPYPSGTFTYPYEGFDAVEVWNGAWDSEVPWQADNEAALAEWGRALARDVRRGRWRPAIGDSDAHLEGQLGTPHTVVPADELSTGAILAAVRAGRGWLAASRAVELAVTVSAGGRGAGVGERVVTDGRPAVVRVGVQGVPSGVVGIHTEAGLVHRAALPAAGSGSVEWRTSAADSAFVRVEVRGPDGRMAALGNPVLLS
ncbi:hypothetical protein Sm713_43800 [Streptomyces sp. TS71-3]|nr:hypothetical protein Sm713_43800 [Streptomyces sp. TS71-3]